MNLGPVRSIAALSSRWRNRFSRSNKSEHLRRGALGEKLASRFLRQNGYKILYRNFRGRRGGEIDLVCRDNNTLIFVEVKTRASEDFGRPVSAVDQNKRRRIAQGGLAWLRLLDNPDILFRFDVVEVIIASEQKVRLRAKARIELIRDAFQLPRPYLY